MTLQPAEGGDMADYPVLWTDRTTAAPAKRNIDLKHWSQEFADVYRVSEALSKTPFVPKEMMGKTADVAAAIMKGRELGLDPFDALGSVYVVHGRVGYYAEFMRRRILQAGPTAAASSKAPAAANPSRPAPPSPLSRPRKPESTSATIRPTNCSPEPPPGCAVRCSPTCWPVR